MTLASEERELLGTIFGMPVYLMNADDIRAHNESEALLDAYRVTNLPHQPHAYREVTVCVPGISSRMRTCRTCGRSSYASVHRYVSST